MSIVWVLENKRGTSANASDAAALAIMGDFPVRVIASVESFIQITKLSKNATPDLLLIDLDDCQMNLSRAESLFAYYVPNVLRVYLSGSDELCNQASKEGSEALLVRKPFDPFHFSRLLRVALTKARRGFRNSAFQYKDLVFDPSKLEIATVGSAKPEKLPLKEGQILKLLIEKKGRCVSRSEIKAEIWGGLSVSTRTIDSHVSRLRKRLSHAEINIESVYGGGYLLK